MNTASPIAAAATSSSFYRLPSVLLFVTAVGHVLVGLVLFREPLAAIWRDGIINSIGPQFLPGAESWLGSVRPPFERAAAFWFVLFGPLLWMIGQVVRRAAERSDPQLLRIIAWDLLGIGIVGVVIMPISGFWLMIAFAPLLAKVAARLDGAATHV